MAAVMAMMVVKVVFSCYTHLMDFLLKLFRLRAHMLLFRQWHP